jgi:SWI/SNF-related matrix-associated actin-dependent regulator of chromatin subfamily D
MIQGPMISGGHPTNSLTPAQMAAQQANAKRAEDRAKLRSRQPTDKNISDGVEEIIIGDGVQRYRDLRDLERRFDATMMRKRLDIQDAVNRNVKVGGYVYNYYRFIMTDFRTAIWDLTCLDQ